MHLRNASSRTVARDTAFTEHRNIDSRYCGMEKTVRTIVLSSTVVLCTLVVLIIFVTTQSKQANDPGIVRDVEFIGDGSQFVSATSHGNILIWETTSGRLIKSFGPEVRGVGKIAVGPDGQQLVAVFDRMQLWDIAAEQPVQEFLGHDGRINCVAFSHDGQMIISGGADRTVRGWATSGDEIFRLEHESEVRDVALFRNGDRLLTASGSFDGREWHDTCVRCWKITTGEVESVVGVSSVAFTCVVISESERLVAAGDSLGTVRVWNSENWTELFSDEMRITTYAELPVDISAIVISPNERYLFCGGGAESVSQQAPRTIQAWDLETGDQVQGYIEVLSAVRGLDLSRDGRWLLSAHGYVETKEGASGELLPFTTGCSVRLWDTSQHNLVRVCSCDDLSE